MKALSKCLELLAIVGSIAILAGFIVIALLNVIIGI
jgi:hypothetical protein